MKGIFMKVDMVIDLQFGSTAKGKVVQYLVNKYNYDACIRVQSIQAGHTIHFNNEYYKMRTIPCAWVNPNIYLILGPGIFIDKNLLLEEVNIIDKIYPGIKDRLFIDYRATYILDIDSKSEKDGQLTKLIGSTGEGAGSSLIRKIWRKGKPTRVYDDNWAKENGFKICDTVILMNRLDKILVEGCQGTLLSVHTSPYYPFVTSRECTAAGILSETGISPIDVINIHGVFRTYPIRVGGNSGKTGAAEISWEEITRRSGYGDNLEPERTTVTNRKRRIFEFSFDDLRHSILLNKPNLYYLTFIDYINYGDYGLKGIGGLSIKSKNFIHELQDRLGIMIKWISTGKAADHYIEL